MSDQLHAQHFAGQISSFVHGFGDLYTAALAAASGVDLRFDHDSGGAGGEQFFGFCLGFFA